MAVQRGCLGGYTLICNCCNGFTEYEIGPEEYDPDPDRWDNWTCEECNGGILDLAYLASRREPLGGDGDVVRRDEDVPLLALEDVEPLSSTSAVQHAEPVDSGRDQERPNGRSVL